MPQISPLSAALRLIVAAAVVIPACRSTGNEPVVTPNDPQVTTAATPLAIVGVRVIPMTTNTLLDNQTVLVRDGVIGAVGSAATIEVPAGSTVIEGAGRYLMPALIDMHVHLSSSQDLEKYVSSGVGTVRNMWGHGSIAGWQRDVAAGVRVGPTIISASPGVDSPPAQWPGTLLVTDARQIPSLTESVTRWVPTARQ